MIIVEIKDGLGNQLFQYAAGKAIAIFLQEELFVDTSYYQYNKSRNYELIYFNLKAEEKILDTLNIESLKFYKEPYFQYDKNFLGIKGNTYLSGYWQSSKYFNKIEKTVREEFTIKDQYIGHLLQKANELKNSNSVSLHIRRGDYLTSKHASFFGLQPLDYYRKAIEYLSQRLKQFKLYIFSDDIAWVEENLIIKTTFELVTNSLTKNHIEDFYLMQNCKHNIIANSSFSWWAAWLNDYNSKIVIAPKNWFKGFSHNTNDLIPNSWIKL